MQGIMPLSWNSGDQIHGWIVDVFIYFIFVSRINRVRIRIMISATNDSYEQSCDLDLMSDKSHSTNGGILP